MGPIDDHTIPATAAADKPLIPNPIDSEEQHRRWTHCDLDDPSLDRRRLWSEKTLVDLELARRLWRRAEIVYVEPDGRIVIDIEWLEERARRLRAAEQRADHGA